MYSIYDGLDGTLGQSSFQATPPRPQPLLFLPGMRVTPVAQASARGGAATTDSVTVVAIINGVERQRGTVLRSQLSAAQSILRSVDRRYPFNEMNSAQFSLQVVERGRFLSADQGRYPFNVINQALAALGFRQIEFAKSYAVPFVTPRYAQSRSRGGAMTLFGLGAVGYALGGLPGAAVGAAVGLLKR